MKDHMILCFPVQTPYLEKLWLKVKIHSTNQVVGFFHDQYL